VTQTDNSRRDSRPTSPLARLAWIVLILATLYLCYFHNLGAVGLIGPDEPRYAWIARDMAETGDWVTPRLYGKPWFEKPVLYYWGAAMSFKVFGVGEAAARFPSALAALLATLAMAWLAWRTYGAETARWLLLLLPTTVGMLGFSHAAATDMPFAGMLTVAMACAARLLGLLPVSASSPPFLSSTLFPSLSFGFFLGLAVLAKGPAALILCGGAVVLWAAITKRWRDAVRCVLPGAIASFCLTALPWYILCSRRNPDFLRIFLIEHNFKRYLTPEFQHIQPIWYYLPVVLLAVFPWTILLFPAARQIRVEQRKLHPDSALTLFFVLWPAFAVVFFTVSQSKLPGYILPAVPPLALLLARSLRATVEKNEEPRRWLSVALGVVLLATGSLYFFFSGKLHASNDVYPVPRVLGLALSTGLAGVTIAVLGLFRLTRMALFAMIVFLLLLVVETDHLLTEFGRGLTARGAPVEAAKTWPEYSADRSATWQLKRSWVYQLNFYTHSALPEWTPAMPKPEWLFLEPARRQQARALGFSCPEYSVYPAVIPCKKSDSVDGLSGLGRSGGNGADGQPR